MTQYVITVAFRIAAGSEQAFMSIMLENARRSLADEPGCLVFDVLRPKDGPADQVLLYEVYQDRAAFEAHLKTPHFKVFDREVSALITAKAVTEYTLESAPHGRAGRA